MKKTITILIIILLCIIFIVLPYVFKYLEQKIQTEKNNSYYEYYLNKKIYGTDVATIINKVIEENKKNKIKKDSEGFYINNNSNSIKIELKMISIKKTFQMESLYINGIQNFVKNFNIILFKCTDIEYHKRTGKISKIVFEQMEE